MGQVMEVQIVAAPTAVMPADPLQACSDEPTAVFDLTTYDALIANGSTLPVSWYSDEAATQPIADPANFPAGSSTVFARLENSSCSSNIVSVELEVGGNIDVDILVDEAPDCDTPLGTISLNIADPTGLDINWNIADWDGLTTVTDVAPGSYFVTVTDPGGCRDTSSIRLNSSGTLLAEYLAADPSCSEPESGSIRLLDIISGSGPFEISFNGADYVPSTDWQVSGLPAGNYTVVIRDNSGCESAQSISLSLPPPPVLDLGADLEIEEGESVFVTPLIGGPLSNLSWSPQSGVVAETGGLSFQPTTTTTYTFSFTDDQGCTNTDQLTITVTPPDMPPPPPAEDQSSVFIPNAFSPNGDGINDTFTIFGDETVAGINLIRIFDRWGNLLFDRSDIMPNDTQQGWQGQVNGRPLKTGVYIYFVELEYADGNTEILKGEVLLVL
jgi:gliding motility-associated-like protein